MVGVFLRSEELGLFTRELEEEVVLERGMDLIGGVGSGYILTKRG